jgi:hypothetical protein
MPKLNVVLMVALAVGVIAAMAFLTLRPTPPVEMEPAQVQKLIRKLGDSDPDIRREGEVGLRQAGNVAIPPLRDASRSSDRMLADRASKLLQELAPADPVCTPKPVE